MGLVVVVVFIILIGLRCAAQTIAYTCTHGSNSLCMLYYGLAPAPTPHNH